MKSWRVKPVCTASCAGTTRSLPLIAISPVRRALAGCGRSTGPYLATPGWYYLHRAIPFYDRFTGRGISRDVATLSASASHLVSAGPDLSVPGFSLEREFGGIRILRRNATEPPVRRWQKYNPVFVFGGVRRAIERVDPDAPAPPAEAGIRFKDEDPSSHRLEGDRK